MAVVPVVLDTQLRCKICASPARRDVDVLIARWKARDLSKEELFEQMAALGIDNPNLDNIKGHTGTAKNPKHVKFVDEEENEKEQSVMEALRDTALALLAEAMGGPDWRERGVVPSEDQILEIQRVLYVHELELRLAAGLPANLTHDHIQKTIAEGTKRKHNQAQEQLLGALTGGIGQVFQKALGSPAAGELEPPVVDAVVVGEEDV